MRQGCFRFAGMLVIIILAACSYAAAKVPSENEDPRGLLEIAHHRQLFSTNFISWIWNLIMNILGGGSIPRSRCSCQSCTDAVWNRNADGYTCGQRIDFLRETTMDENAACLRVAGVEFTDTCGPSCNPQLCDGRTREYYCGCPACTETIVNSETDSISCYDRILFVQRNYGGYENEIDACRFVTQKFPSSPCGFTCNPNTCPGGPGPNIYCFPQTPVTYRNAWGGYILQVKDSGISVCGPGDNKFKPDTVSFNNNELKLQFRYVNGAWTGSEVRVLRQNGARYEYGSFEFRVKSISVRDTTTNQQISNALPISLVLGLFTWDPVEDFGTNFNHEVDIEISQWDNINNPDAQFLVQPDGTPQKFRFWTGGSSTRQQSGHTWKFTWNPGEIDWYTNADGGITHQYSTAQEILNSRPDHVQCLPANVEVRMNLWNVRGNNTPTGMTANHAVEVIIDNFVYTPSGLTGLPSGSRCSKIVSA